MGGYARDRDGNRRRVEIPRTAFGISHSDGRYSRGCITSRKRTMPDYGATPAELAKYGDKLNLWQSIMLLQKWSPLIGFVQRVAATNDPYTKSVIALEACEWIASQTNATLDDELAKHVAALVRTKEGEAFVKWFLAKVGGVP